MFKPALDLPALFAHHRAAFGDARMEATDDDDKKAEEEAAAAALKAGESDDDAAADDDEPDDEEEAKKALGDKGKQALDRMKAKWQAERDKRIAAEKRAEAAAKPKGDETDDATVRAAANRAATAKANERILRSEIRAAAAGKLQDPKDALTLLDLSKFEVDEDGNVDEDDIADAIAELLERKPYLGVTQGDGREKKFKGTADAGARGNAGKPQLTEADVKKLAAEGKHAEIEQARVDGRLNQLLGIT